MHENSSPYFFLEKVFFLIIEIRETIVLNLFLKIDIFWRHEDLELYLFIVFKKNSSSYNRAPKYPFFNEESKFDPNFSYLIFECFNF